MPSSVFSLGRRLDDGLRQLSRRPWALAALLILANAVLVPYLGIVHDAQIYSGLVLNRLEPELLSGDLFFQFGSQDKFSLFSPLVAPLAQWLGVKAAFFLGYVVSVGIFLAALTHLVARLWPDSPGAVVGLVFLSFIPVAYGGYVPLHVLEPFLSARIPACALTIWGLAELADRRWTRGGIFLAGAAAMHPLMALPGFMLVGIVAIQRRWGLRGNALILGGGMVVLAGLLAYPPLASRLFGQVDAEWFEINRQTNCYQFPLDWTADQWFRNLFALAVLACAAWQARGSSTERSQVLAACSLIGVAGFFGCLAFTQLPYALLLKGQAYRWLWLPLAVSLPASFDLAWTLWRSQDWRCRIGAVGILAAVQMTNYLPLEFLAVFAFVPVFWYGLAVFAKSLPQTDRISWSLLAGVLFGFAIWGIYRVSMHFTLGGDLRAQATLIQEINGVVATLSQGVILPLVLLAVALVHGRIASARFAWGCALAALFVQIGLFAWSNTDRYKAQQPFADELQFVEQFLNERRGQETNPICVYSDYGTLGQYWVEWRARSFYDCFQLAGFVFNRETAIEGKRRASVVAPFEAAALAKRGWDCFPEFCREKIEAWLDVPVKERVPQPEDLLRLAREESIDYVVLFKTHIDGLAAVRHGDVAIYDCRALRETSVARRD